MPALDPGIHRKVQQTCSYDLCLPTVLMDRRAFASPKRLRPRRRAKPGDDSGVCGQYVEMSVQPKLAIDRLQLRRLDQTRVRHQHGVQRPFELLDPEGQEALQLGEFREQVVI